VRGETRLIRYIGQPLCWLDPRPGQDGTIRRRLAINRDDLDFILTRAFKLPPRQRHAPLGDIASTIHVF
jgi:hypothetical protein